MKTKKKKLQKWCMRYLKKIKEDAESHPEPINSLLGCNCVARFQNEVTVAALKIGKEVNARKTVDTIEKMLDTAANCTERKDARNELIDLLKTCF
jgi:hypothetical protein